MGKTGLQQLITEPLCCSVKTGLMLPTQEKPPAQSRFLKHFAFLRETLVSKVIYPALGDVSL